MDGRRAWEDLTIEEARNLADDLASVIREYEKSEVTSIIRRAVSQIHAERYGMTVQDHAELDKVLKAMNGYLEYAERKQEVKE